MIVPFFILVTLLDLLPCLAFSTFSVNRLQRKLFMIDSQLDELMGRIFPNPPLNLYTKDKRSHDIDDMNDGRVSIIDSPYETTHNKLLSFNVKDQCDRLLDSCDVTPGPRSKPLHYTFKGVGTGKTRVFEEIRRYLMTQDGVLVIAITFNSFWSAHPSYDNFGVTAPEVSCALSVVARMASVFYGTELGTVRPILRNEIAYIDALSKLDNALGEKLIRSFIRHAITQVNAQRPHGKGVTKFVMLVDEAVAMQTMVADTFKSVDCSDVTTVLRSAILDDYIDVGVGATLAN
jgi:hypothetical protein